MLCISVVILISIKICNIKLFFVILIIKNCEISNGIHFLSVRWNIIIIK